MMSFKEIVNENEAGNDLHQLKLKLGDWWKKNSNNPKFKNDKKKLEEAFNKALKSLDDAIDIVYENE